ncbi:uncharacterized protein LOC108734675 [Agrilus planipennis]|uniref:Uncharacterized protein LOC108734675 n=1 Tax=Agrilus planipennis TaxID=224129 RepID=A0A1W4WCX9_AGRPL|nr:uncharacterized protein LOC108734675 [Agrilus planipennis]
MSDYDPRFNYPSSLSYPPPPEGRSPPPPYAEHRGPPPACQYPPPPGGYYPPPPFGHNPSSSEGQYPPPAGECPYPTAPPHDTKDAVPVPGYGALYPELPKTYYPPPPHSNSSSSSSSPSSTSSNHTRSNAKKQPPKYVPPPPGPIYRPPSIDPSYREPPPPYTPSPPRPQTNQTYYHNNAGSFSLHVTCCCCCCCHFNNPNNSRPNYNGCRHRRGPHNNKQHSPRIQTASYVSPPKQKRTEKVFIKTLKNEARYSTNEPVRSHYESVPLEGAGYYWIDWTSDKGVPPTAVHGGIDVDGAEIFVGRAYHEGDWIPAKVIPSRQVAYVAYGGGEHVKHKFQVLCEQRFDWVPSGGGNIPFGAVEGGRTSDGELLYIGRVWHDGAHTVGKIHPTHRCLYIPFNCTEMSFSEYEVLVLRTQQFNMSGPSYYWMEWTADRPVPPTAVSGGKDADGSPIYVGRALHERDWIPAKVIPDRKVAYVPFAGGEHVKTKFQILCEQKFEWVPAENGHVPPGAVEGGRTSNGEILYIGRVSHGKAQTIGKIQPSHGCLYIPYDSKEQSFKKYEVLVLIK